MPAGVLTFHLFGKDMGHVSAHQKLEWHDAMEWSYLGYECEKYYDMFKTYDGNEVFGVLKSNDGKTYAITRKRSDYYTHTKFTL